MPNVRLIAAIDDKRGIAKNGALPWDIPNDRAYFRDHIKHGPVVMGWKTFASNGFKPYGEGSNTVITRRALEAVPGVWIVHDAEKFFKQNQNDIWVIGGGEIFSIALPFATELYITHVTGDFACDTFFPDFTDKFELALGQPPLQENGHLYQYQVWQRKN